MMSISRRISEVVIHATETAENKNIGSIETTIYINNSDMTVSFITML